MIIRVISWIVFDFIVGDASNLGSFLWPTSSLAQNPPNSWHGEQNHQHSGHKNPRHVDQPMTMWQTSAHDIGQMDEGVSGKERGYCQVHRP